MKAELGYLPRQALALRASDEPVRIDLRDPATGAGGPEEPGVYPARGR